MTDAERYAAAGRVFDAVVDLPPDRRVVRVRELCGPDETLEREVESLLAAHESVGEFIEAPAIEVAAALMARDDVVETPPARIGHYEVLSLIGQGGMGDVYEAFDLTLGRRVAIKLPRRALTVDTDAVSRFEHEARAASSLNHPNIITIYEIGGFGDTPFIAMELVEGHALVTAPGEPMPVAVVVRIGRQLAQALAVAHAAGIVHGDVKPDNIMVRRDGYAKILDFGVARLLPGGSRADDGERRSSGRAFGTPGYIAPEQVRGEAASAASDVFALGVVLYELATGGHPFAGDAKPARRAPPDDGAAPRLPSGLVLPPALDRLLRHMLAHDPAERPDAQHVEAVMASLGGATADVGRPDPVRSLPPQRTSFIGRSGEIEALASMLDEPGTRLITLTGTAGTGKTRLALQVAARVADQYPGGLSFVNLAPISDPAMVTGAVALAHGVREVVGRPLVSVLCDELRARGRMLALMDNFEQVAPAAPLVRELLDECPDLTLLVTSRLVLHLSAEREFQVPPLPLPDKDDGPDGLLSYASVALFVQRARVAKSDFALTERNAASVAAICRRLDGLPLAIELAAARIKILPPAELLLRLEHRLDVLGEAAHDRPARQQTLRRAIDWSYYLLAPAEQRLFRRLSVFVGGGTLEAVEAVCNATEDLGIDVLDGVAALVDNSLLVPRAADEDQSRFFMLETVREYARERLEESGEATATRRAHAAYVLVVAEEERPTMTPAEREAWLLWCDREHDNIRAAIQCLVATREAEWGVRLGGALLRFWEQREHLTEGRESLAALLAIPFEPPPTRARARALCHACMLADMLGDRDTAQAEARQAYDMFQQLGDTQGVATTLHALAWQAQLRGRFADARRMLEQTAALWDQLGDAAAADMARSNMASVAKAEGQHDSARALLEQLVVSATRRGDDRAIASALNELGDLAAARGDPVAARRHHDDSLALFRRIDDGWGVARVLTDLASMDMIIGDYEAADRTLAEALHIARGLGHQRGVARRLELLALSACRQTRHAVAVKLASAAVAIRRRIGVAADSMDRQKLESALADARTRLSALECDAAWAEGQIVPPDQLVPRPSRHEGAMPPRTSSDR
jgi:predicted ATPase/serine/threonine protein kinase